MQSTSMSASGVCTPSRVEPKILRCAPAPLPGLGTPRLTESASIQRHKMVWSFSIVSRRCSSPSRDS